jgi:hypothetical protein
MGVNLWRHYAKTVRVSAFRRAIKHQVALAHPTLSLSLSLSLSQSINLELTLLSRIQ